ncbi:hypothetical protein QP157_11835 [Sphingomonas sp. LR61]
MQLLGEAPAMLGFLFTADADSVVEDDALASLKGDTGAVLTAGIAALEQLDDWRTEAIEGALRHGAHRRPGLKPRSPSVRCAWRPDAGSARRSSSRWRSSARSPP